MLLAVDVGNTNIVIGAFDGDRLAVQVRLHTDHRATGDELGLAVTELLERRGIEARQIEAVVVANVVPPLASAITEMSQAAFGHPPLVVGPGMRTGVAIKYEDPRLVGADRIANAVAGRHLYGCPAILLDFGTATTFDALSAAGEYLGGAMAPGILISLDALVSRASKLNRVELAAPPSVIGRSPQASMQAGFVFGYVGLVQGIVGRMRDEIGAEARVIATGGLADLFAPLIPEIERVDPHLTLTGLRLIHDLNR
ncbi:MAG: type III pantothenate kinase [Candidatus Dormibacteria bacterium]